MSLIDQALRLTNGAKLPVPPRRNLIPYAGAEPKPAPKPLAAGTVVDGVDCGGMTDDPKKQGVPVYLQAQNRRQLSPERQAAFDAKVAAARLAVQHNSALAAKKPEAPAEPKAPSKAQQKAEERAARKEAAATAKAAAKAATKAKRAAKAAAPKAPRKKDGPTIGGVANAAILAGKSNEEALAAVMKAFPACKSNLSCISWYRGKLREQGLLKGELAARSAPAKGEPDKPKAKAKSARIKVAIKKKAPGKRPMKAGKGKR